MMTKWIYKEDELPSAYENIEVLQYKDIPTHISVGNKNYLN